MPKKIKIILIIIGIILLGTILYLYFIQKKNNQSTKPTMLEPSSINLFTIPPEGAPKMTLKNNNGEIETNNLFRSPVEKLSRNGITFTKNIDFQASFYPEDQGFIITLLNPDLEEARTKAENNLLETLGITKDQACKLKVDLGVPAFTNLKASGVNYGLSFCPSGKQLPKNK